MKTPMFLAFDLYVAAVSGAAVESRELLERARATASLVCKETGHLWMKSRPVKGDEFRHLGGFEPRYVVCCARCLHKEFS